MHRDLEKEIDMEGEQIYGERCTLDGRKKNHKQEL